MDTVDFWSCDLQIEKDEQYVKTVVKLAGVMEDMVKCNNAIDIYEEYFPEVGVHDRMMLIVRCRCQTRGAQSADLIAGVANLNSRDAHTSLHSTALHSFAHTKFRIDAARTGPT